MLKVTITSTTLRNMKGIGKVSGKPYDMNFQTVWVYTHEKDGTPLPFPEKVEIIAEKAEDGAALFLPAGEYTLHPSSIFVDPKGNLAVAPRLIPVKRA